MKESVLLLVALEEVKRILLFVSDFYIEILFNYIRFIILYFVCVMYIIIGEAQSKNRRNLEERLGHVHAVRTQFEADLGEFFIYSYNVINK